MPESIEIRDFDAAPDAELVSTLRDQADERDEAVGVTFPTADDQQKRLVVSPRGTCVLLNDEVSEQTFHRSLSAGEIADALRD